MQTERNENEITQKAMEFLSSKEEDGVFMYPLANSEAEEGKFDVSFCAIGFAVDERGEKVDFHSFTAEGVKTKSTTFLREIFEWDFQGPTSGVDNLDGWYTATKISYDLELPLFSISFGVYENTGNRAVFIHAREGVSLGSAVNTFKKYAEINLFGGVVNIEQN